MNILKPTYCQDLRMEVSLAFSELFFFNFSLISSTKGANFFSKSFILSFDMELLGRLRSSKQIGMCFLDINDTKRIEKHLYMPPLNPTFLHITSYSFYRGNLIKKTKQSLWNYFSAFCKRIASFKSFSASSLLKRTAFDFNKFHTFSFSSFVWTLANGLD